MIGARAAWRDAGYHDDANTIVTSLNILDEGISQDHGQLTRTERNVDIRVVLTHVKTSDAFFES